MELFAEAARQAAPEVRAKIQAWEKLARKPWTWEVTLMKLPRVLLLTACFVLLSSCSAPKPYIIPRGADVGTLVLLDATRSGGYKILIDGRDAGLLMERKAIPVTPGKHSIRLIKKETVVRSQMREVEQSYTTTVTVARGEAKEVTLSSHSSGYSLKEGKWKPLPGQEEEETPMEQRIRESQGLDD